MQIDKKLFENILYTNNRPDIVMIKGKGSYLWDIKGKRYLDFISGWAVNSLGHSHKVISKTLRKQSKILINTSPSYYNINQLEFADLLVKNTIFQKVFFCSTGAEANESAIKLARKYGKIKKNGAYEIITLKNSFHGRTLATMSASGKPSFKNLFEPKVPGFHHVQMNNIDELKSKITDKICAIMLEPIQGEGGVYEVEKGFVDEICNICRENKILLIFDEIQTGFARTGKLFYYQHYDFSPDIMTVAKGIGGGFPLAAMLCKKELDIFDAGEQGGTFRDTSLGTELGKEILKEIIKKKLWEKVAENGAYTIEKLKLLKSKYPVKNIRGKGLLIGFDLEGCNIDRLRDNCLKNGLLINTPQPETVRLIPDLNVSKKSIDLMIDIIERTIKET